MARERPSLLPPNNAKGKFSSLTSSHYPVSDKEAEQPNEGFDGDEDLTTSGRTYEELVSASQRQSQHGGIATQSHPRDSAMSDDTEESEPSQNNGRHSVGMMLGKNLSSWSTGRNSLSNWSTIGGERQADDEGCDDDMESCMGNIMNTGRKSNVSLPSLVGGRNSLETPIDVIARHVNISQRRSNQVGSRATQRSNVGYARTTHPSQMDRGGRPTSLNMSHISSSSSSGVLETSGDDLVLENSWTPIRTSLEHSFDKNIANAVAFPHSGSLSPIRGRSMPNSSNLSSPKRSPIKLKSPIRSPFGAVSPNRSPKRSPKKTTSSKHGTAGSMTLLKKKALSPNGTYSLKEAEGKLLSLTEFEAITNVENGSDSSNMSLSSGSDATLEQGTSSQMLVLRSLSSSRNGYENAGGQESGVAKATQEAGEGMTTLTPEKSSIKDSIRSPVPTPNSQRKEIKRFRSSVPTANYLAQGDLTQANSTRKVMAMVVEKKKSDDKVDDMAQDGSNEEMTNSYENAFVFPSDSIPLLRIKTLRMLHDQVISNGSLSHQYQLNKAGTNLISLQEVVLPSIAIETNAVLKRQQAKAERHAQDCVPASQAKDVVEVIQICRKVVYKCISDATKVVGEAWREREKERQKLQIERLKREAEQQRSDELNAKRNRKEARARSRQERYERQMSEKQLNHPRNKAMWQEVAKLMVDIQKLEKEERLWKEALFEVNRLVEHHQPPEQLELDSIFKEKGGDHLLTSVEEGNLESIATTLVGDVAMATERINWMLNSVSFAIEESEKLRKEAYEKYQYDGHKFWGYPNVDDSKGLFIALSMESPFKG